MVQQTGLKPARPRVKTVLLDRFVFCCLVEDRGNAPRLQSPCKGNQLTLEHPPKLVRVEGLEPPRQMTPESEPGASALFRHTRVVARLRLELSKDVL